MIDIGTVWTIGLAILVLILGILAIHIIRSVVRRLCRNLNVGVTSLIDMCVKVVLYIVMLTMVLDRVGVNSSSIIAFVGGMGIVAGFGLSNQLTNIGAGVLILTLQPFVLGDVVEISGTKGKTEEIGLLMTKIRVSDSLAMIPNAIVMSNKLFNFDR